MALVLGIKRGRFFTVGDLRVRVVHIAGPEAFKVVVSGDNWKTQTHNINSDFKEIAPEVLLKAGLDGNSLIARCVIQAPKELKILQEAPWRATPYATKQWEDFVPNQPITKMFEIAKFASSISKSCVFKSVKGDQTRVFNLEYGALLFRVENKLIHEIRVKDRVINICPHCINTEYVLQWDDIDNRGVKVPCTCKRRS